MKRRALFAATHLALVAAFILIITWSHPAWSQSVSIDLGQGGQAGTTSRLIQIAALMGVLSLAPSLLVMVTAFTRIVIVLSLLRSGIGAQGTPPNTVIIGLALFLTFFVMQPTFEQAWTNGLLPMAQGQTTDIEGLRLTAEPFRKFMLLNARPADLSTFLDLAKLKPPAQPQDMPWRVLVPAFMVGELSRAFEMGFVLFLPFLIIDMVVASILMSMGMMMLPPSIVSLPFKLTFFVLVDGWRLIAGSLVQSFHT
jgi:flagellar biosynthetic protein FliP